MSCCHDCDVSWSKDGKRQLSRYCREPERSQKGLGLQSPLREPEPLCNLTVRVSIHDNILSWRIGPRPQTRLHPGAADFGTRAEKNDNVVSEMKKLLIIFPAR